MPGVAMQLGYVGFGEGTANAVVTGNVMRGELYASADNNNSTITANTFVSGFLQGITASQWPANAWYEEPAVPAATSVVIRPNQYEPGRANITVLNWQNAGSVSVNLGSVLSQGAAYEIRNAQDFFGAPVASGTYTGAAISLPMGGLSHAIPVGTAAPAATGADFNVFVVLSASSSATPPRTPAPPPPPSTPTQPPAGRTPVVTQPPVLTPTPVPTNPPPAPRVTRSRPRR